MSPFQFDSYYFSLPSGTRQIVDMWLKRNDTDIEKIRSPHGLDEHRLRNLLIIHMNRKGIGWEAIRKITNTDFEYVGEVMKHRKAQEQKVRTQQWG